ADVLGHVGLTPRRSPRTRLPDTVGTTRPPLPTRQPAVRTGLDILPDSDWKPLRGRRVGLVCHPASGDSQLRHAAALLAPAPGVELAALFGPEHGFAGVAQDLIGVGDGTAAGLRVYSLYGNTVESLRPTAEQLHGLDALVIDLQDVGSRYYTFQATM